MDNGWLIMMVYWLVVYLPPLKNMKVSWDYYAQYMKSHKSHVPKHKPEYVYIYNPYYCIPYKPI